MQLYFCNESNKSYYIFAKHLYERIEDVNVQNEDIYFF